MSSRHVGATCGQSSAAAEIFAALVALNKLLHLGCVTSELSLSYPQPIMLEVDNATAITFSKDQVRRSKLRHIDCRQAWVEALRDEHIVKLLSRSKKVIRLRLLRVVGRNSAGKTKPNGPQGGPWVC